VLIDIVIRDVVCEFVYFIFTWSTC